MLKEIGLVEEEFETKVKAIITDAASDCRKARSLVVAQIPRILSLDCFAHQVQTSHHGVALCFQRVQRFLMKAEVRLHRCNVASKATMLFAELFLCSHTKAA